MGWETTLYTGISYMKETYDSKYKIEDDLEDIKRYISINETRLKSLAFITEPKKYCGEDEDPTFWLENEAQESLEELRRLYVEKYKLELLLENFDVAYNKETGLFKALPDGFGCDDAYIKGDFIKSEEK